MEAESCKEETAVFNLLPLVQNASFFACSVERNMSLTVFLSRMTQCYVLPAEGARETLQEERALLVLMGCLPGFSCAPSSGRLLQCAAVSSI